MQRSSSRRSAHKGDFSHRQVSRRLRRPRSRFWLWQLPIVFAAAFLLWSWTLKTRRVYAWWAREEYAGIVLEAYGVEPFPNSTTLRIVVALDGDDCHSSFSSIATNPIEDLAYVTDNLEMLRILRIRKLPVIYVVVSSRVELWNIAQDLGRRAGYAILMVSSCNAQPSPNTILALREAFEIERFPFDHMTLVVPATLEEERGDSIELLPSPMGHLVENAGRVQRQLSTERYVVAVSSSFFALHLKRVERFAPNLQKVFETTSRYPANDIAARMLAANVPLGLVRRAFVTAQASPPLLNVTTPPLPPLAQVKRKRYAPIAYDKVADTVVASCDFRSRIETKDIKACERECSKFPAKCKAFSYVEAWSTCYLKSCSSDAKTLAGVDTFVKVPVPINRRDECVVDGTTGLSPVIEHISEPKRIAIIVTVHDAAEWVVRCVSSVWTHTKPETYTMYLVNDNSTEATKTRLEALLDNNQKEKEHAVRLVNWNEKLGETLLSGYTRAVNVGLRAARADEKFDAYCLLNSDTEVLSGDWLEQLAAAAFSSDEIGIVGPLSNAASYQSVPKHKEKRGNVNEWSKNDLRGTSWTPHGVHEAVARSSRRATIDVPVLNGFCLFVKRQVVETVGLMDDVAFPHGFGEENDFCLRAKRLGFSLKVLEGGYVWHHKSKSYGDSRRMRLSSLARVVMDARWGLQLTAAIRELEGNIQLKEARRRVEANVYKYANTACGYLRNGEKGGTVRVLFVLNPTRSPRRLKTNDALEDVAMRGGWVSIVNQAWGLRRRGVCASVAVSQWIVPVFEKNFPQLAEECGNETFLSPYPDAVRTPVDLARALYDRASTFDVIIATLFTTVETLGYLKDCHPRAVTCYFVQDYEADFSNVDESQRNRALESYSHVDGMVLFAKTRWLQTKVMENHGNVTVHKILPSVDLDSFDRARKLQDAAPSRKRTTVVAMIRPSTPRRNALGTIQVLAELRKRRNDADIVTFGCDTSELPAQLPENATHLGLLDRFEIAHVFARSDIFLDMSSWQAFGRTGLEAMALGCVPVLPAGSGSEEYAEDGNNALLHDPTRSTQAVDKLDWLVGHPGERARMRAAALETAKKYDLSTASRVLLSLLCDALRRHRGQYGGVVPSLCGSDDFPSLR